MKKFLAVFSLIIIIGCGYTTRGFIYPESGIYIKPIVNKISITGEDRLSSVYTDYPVLLEKKLTNILINKFNVDGNLKVTDPQEGAMSLECEITNYIKESLRYNSENDVKERKLKLYVHMTLYGGDGKLLKDVIIIGDTDYEISGSEESAQEELSAQDGLIDDTARRILEAVVEAW